MAKNNECVIITGASGKLGQNFSRCLLEIGYDVIGISRSKVNLLEGKTDTAAANSGKFYSLQADLTSPDFLSAHNGRATEVKRKCDCTN